MKNIVTVDFEGWMDTCTAQKYLKEKDLQDGFYQDRVPESAHALLHLLDEHKLKATFFVLGSLAEKYPDIVKKISHSGHRIGSHSYRHKKVNMQTAREFEIDIQKSLKALSAVSDAPIESFRAPNWSIDEHCLWAFDVLRKYGFKYDSSIGFSSSSFLSDPCDCGIMEVPRSAFNFLGLQIPFAGGFFLRTYPLGFTEHLIRQTNARGIPVVLYVHPWELDFSTPRIPMRWIDDKIQYLCIQGTVKKLKKLFERFEFVPLEEYFN